MEIEEVEGAVALLDALGTKGIWKNNPPDEVIEKWESLIDYWNKFFKDELVAEKHNPSIRAFSDTVIISGHGKDLYDTLISVSIDTKIFIQEALSRGILFKGCISAGKIFHSKTMFLGPAIDEAAEYYRLPNWIGVSACPSAHKLLSKKRFNGKPSIPYVTYDIPLKTGLEKNGFAINFQEGFSDFVKSLKEYPDTAVKYKDAYESPLQALEKVSNNTTDVQASLKIRNTINFLNSL